MVENVGDNVSKRTVSLWHGVSEVAGTESVGQGPGHVRGEAAVTGILPINVPTLRKLKANPHIEWSPGNNGLYGGNQAHFRLGCPLAGMELCGGGACGKHRNRRCDDAYPYTSDYTLSIIIRAAVGYSPTHRSTLLAYMPRGRMDKPLYDDPALTDHTGGMKW